MCHGQFLTRDHGHREGSLWLRHSWGVDQRDGLTQAPGFCSAVDQNRTPGEVDLPGQGERQCGVPVPGLSGNHDEFAASSQQIGGMEQNTMGADHMGPDGLKGGRHVQLPSRWVVPDRRARCSFTEGA